MSFFGLNIANQGLFTARAALDVTSHNISNAETTGYTRQQVVQKAGRPIDTGTSVGMYGTGPVVEEIKRVRDEYFDYKYWDANTLLGGYESKALHMEQIEKMFNEPSDSGFSTSMNNLFDSIQDLTKNPADPSYKAQTVGMASAFCQYFNTVSTSMKEYQQSLNGEVKQIVNEINSKATQIARLNEQIYTIEFTGQNANDLRDQRDLLIDELSKLVPTEVSEIQDTNGYSYIEIKINGETLVSHEDERQLSVVERTVKVNPEDADDLYDIYWTNGNKFDVAHSNMTGELNAIIQLRDGNNNSNFKGTIDTTTATSITIKGTNRYDIPSSGQVAVGTNIYTYSSVTYDSSTGNITLNGVTPDPSAETGAIYQGQGVSYKGLPYYMQKLNDFVRTFAMEFNKVHKSGQLEDGSYGGGFFVSELGNPALLDESDVYSYTQITAENFTVNQSIEEDVSLFATSYSATSGESDNGLILDLVRIKDSNSFGNSDPANYMEMLIAYVGIDAMKANTFYSNQNAITNTISNQRLSESSVDLNEETMNMVKYQQAYNLAAKMIQTFDEIYDVTINGLT